MSETQWTTWGYRHSTTPNRVYTPRSISEAQKHVARVAIDGGQIKVVGASRSSSAIAQPTDSMMSLDYLVGATSIDVEAGEATFLAGTTVYQANKILATYGLAFENLGRLGQQTLAGAVATGTHGTGLTFGIIPTQVLRLTLITATGELITCSPDESPKIFSSALVGLGALGVLVSLTFRVVPMFRLHAVERGRSYEEIIHSFADRARNAEHYEVTWYPGSPNVRTRRLTRLPLLTDGYMPSSARISQARRHGRDYALNNGIFEISSFLSSKIPAARPAVNRAANFSKRNRRYADLAPSVFILNRTVHQNNMEYAFDLATFDSVMAEVRTRLNNCNIRSSFPLVIRTAAADHIPLSPAFGRETVFISAREYWRSDFKEYFGLLEEIFIAHKGRPHWGQMHSLTAKELAELYPQFADFTAIREELDPEEIFLNPYLEKVLLTDRSNHQPPTH